jgi:ribosomal protein S6--L-glutamate ligase
MPQARGRVAVVGWPQEANRLLAAGWRARGIDAVLMPPAHASDLLRPCDVAVARLDVLPTLDGVEPGLREVAELGRRGVRVVNRPEGLLGAHDKLRTATLLAKAGVPHPQTEHLATAEDDPVLVPPVVVKPRFGSWGADVFLCETAEELEQVLDDVKTRSWFKQHGALVQELLPPQGHDLRAVVAAGRVVGAIERIARPGEWRTNVSLGGRRRPVAPPESACALAVRAVAAVGLDLGGVDLYPYRGTYVVLELNGAVEFDRGYDLWGEDVYEATATALRLPRPVVGARAATA